MMCDRCGENNLDEASTCRMCGFKLSDAASRAEAARLWRIRRYASGAPRLSTRARGILSVLFGAAGAFIVLSSLDLQMDLLPVGVAAICAFLGLYLGLSVIRELRFIEGVVWSRGLALAGAVISTGVLAAPALMVLVAAAMFPHKLVAEPRAINNLRKLSIAIQAYATDNGDRLPGWMSDASGTANHNVWDQQLAPYLQGDENFLSSADGKGIRSPSQPPPRTRVVYYGLNGLLITRPKAAFDGNADWAAGPYSVSLDALENRVNTIVLAELATSEPMGHPYAFTEAGGRKAMKGDSSAWNRALSQWIDVDPRAWVETDGPVKSYFKRQWNPNRGVGRSLHPGGACYAFADGHVAFLKLRQTATGGAVGLPTEQWWDGSNTWNMWNPR
ncbi:MAG TPA: H-X9-DG-CTERM domain-containing protein [Armatimonadota bacterium]|jgi:prepilin-type processing-associated H-X9-DG protein